MSLLINYPLNGTVNNLITNVNENNFKITSSNIKNSFQSSNGQGKYLVSNQVSLTFGIPVINNYTSIYNTSPWQIEFELCVLGNASTNNKGIFKITRPDTNGNISFAIYFNGFTNTETDKNIGIDVNFAKVWHKYVIFVDQNIIKVKIDGIEQEKYSRSFYLDKENITMLIGSLDNRISCGIKNIKVYYGEISAPSKVDYYHDVTSSIIIRKETSKAPLEAVIPFPYKQFTDMEFILSDTYKNFISVNCL